MKIARMQKIIFITVLSPFLQVYAMQSITEPVATYDVGFNNELEVTSVPVQDQHYKVFIIAAAQPPRSCSVKSSGSSLDLSMPATSAKSKGVFTDKTDKNVAMEESNDKDETLSSSSSSSSSSEHFSAEVEVGKKGGWFHCKTRCKSKTLAKYAATVVGGIIAGILI